MSSRTSASHVAISMVAIFLVGAPAAAQPRLSSGSEKSLAALTVVGLTTVQPVDNTYVGWPYLDRGLGGIGLGAAAGLNILTPSAFAATLEVSTASVSASQTGRLVGGSAEGTLRDTLLSMLAGISTNSRAVLLQAGVSWLAATPRLNDIDVDDPGAQHLAFTAGFDGARPVGARTAIVANVRYSIVPRTTRLVQIGVGRQIVRAGVGVRVRLD
jgi:hypothetical protein